MVRVAVGVRCSGQDEWLVSPGNNVMLDRFVLDTAGDSPFDGMLLEFASAESVDAGGDGIVRLVGVKGARSDLLLAPNVAALIFGPPHGSPQWRSWLDVVRSAIAGQTKEDI